MVSNPPPGSNKCTNCGMILKPTDKFCVNCGTSVKTDQTNPFVALNKCPNCGAPVKPQYKYCMSCRTKLPDRSSIPSGTTPTSSIEGNISRCPRCQTELKPNDKFCQKCGYKLENIPDKLANRPSITGDVSRFCGNCGAPLKTTSKFCPTCGVKARSPTEQDAGENIETITQKIEPKIQEESKVKSIPANEGYQASNSKISPDLPTASKAENQQSSDIITRTVLEQHQEIARLRRELEKQAQLRIETELKSRQEMETIRTSIENQLRSEFENKIQREIETRLQSRMTIELRQKQELEDRLRKELNSQIRGELHPMLMEEIGEKLREKYEEQLNILQNEISSLKKKTRDVSNMPEKAIDSESLTADVIPESEQTEKQAIPELENNPEPTPVPEVSDIENETENIDENEEMEQSETSNQENPPESSVENAEIKTVDSSIETHLTESTPSNSESQEQSEKSLTEVPFEAIPFPTAQNAELPEEKQKPIGSFMILPDPMAICRFSTHDKITPDKMAEYSFWAIIRTTTSLSVVLPDKNLPDLVNLEHGWRLLKYISMEESNRYQVLASITIPILQAGLEIHPLSAYSEDYCLIKEVDIDSVKKILLENGLQIKYVE